LAAQLQTALVGGASTFADVAGTTARHDVLPGVVTALRPGRDVVEGLSGTATVLASVTVPAKDGAPCHRHHPPVRDFDIPVEPNHRGKLDRHRLRSPDLVAADDDAGLVVEHEHYRPSFTDHRQGLKACVQYQGSRHL
jgi:hypothetical protein